MYVVDDSSLCNTASLTSAIHDEHREEMKIVSKANRSDGMRWR